MHKRIGLLIPIMALTLGVIAPGVSFAKDSTKVSQGRQLSETVDFTKADIEAALVAQRGTRAVDPSLALMKARFLEQVQGSTSGLRSADSLTAVKLSGKTGSVGLVYDAKFLTPQGATYETKSGQRSGSVSMVENPSARLDADVEASTSAKEVSACAPDDLNDQGGLVWCDDDKAYFNAYGLFLTDIFGDPVGQINVTAVKLRGTNFTSKGGTKKSWAYARTGYVSNLEWGFRNARMSDYPTRKSRKSSVIQLDRTPAGTAKSCDEDSTWKLGVTTESGTNVEFSGKICDKVWDRNSSRKGWAGYHRTDMASQDSLGRSNTDPRWFFGGVVVGTPTKMTPYWTDFTKLTLDEPWILVDAECEMWGDENSDCEVGAGGDEVPKPQK